MLLIHSLRVAYFISLIFYFSAHKFHMICMNVSQAVLLFRLLRYNIKCNFKNKYVSNVGLLKLLIILYLKDMLQTYALMKQV